MEQMNNVYGIISAISVLLGVYLGYKLKSKKSDIDQFQEEFNRLQKRVDTLERKNGELMEKVAILQSENVALRIENGILTEKISKLEGD